MQQWLIKSGHWIYSTDRATVPSHVMLSGGKIAIPANMRSDPDSPFLLSMARDIVENRPIHVVERTFVRGTYRMFADLDIPREDPADAPEFLMALLDRAIGALPEDLCVFPIVICTRKWYDGKIGAHLVWSDELRVTDEHAMDLRNVWIDALGEEDREFWEKTIDDAVYHRNGLRMPWSLKKNGHPDAAYVPTHVVLEDASNVERIDPHLTHHVEARDVHEVAKWLSRASIHALEADANASASASARKRKVVTAPPKSGLHRKSNNKDNAHLPDGDSFMLSEEDALELIQVLPKAYGIRETSSIGARCKKIGGGKSILVSARSRVCAIAGREHSANHVFFDLKNDGTVFQRCHSSKCEGKTVELKGIYHALSDDHFAEKDKVSNMKVHVKTPNDIASMASILIAKMEEQRLWR